MADNPLAMRDAARRAFVAFLESQIPILEPGFFIRPEATWEYRASVWVVETL